MKRKILLGVFSIVLVTFGLNSCKKETATTPTVTNADPVVPNQTAKELLVIPANSSSNTVISVAPAMAKRWTIRTSGVAPLVGKMASTDPKDYDVNTLQWVEFNSKGYFWISFANVDGSFTTFQGICTAETDPNLGIIMVLNNVTGTNNTFMPIFKLSSLKTDVDGNLSFSFKNIAKDPAGLFVQQPIAKPAPVPSVSSTGANNTAKFAKTWLMDKKSSQGGYYVTTSKIYNNNPPTYTFLENKVEFNDGNYSYNNNTDDGSVEKLVISKYGTFYQTKVMPNGTAYLSGISSEWKWTDDTQTAILIKPNPNDSWDKAMKVVIVISADEKSFTITVTKGSQTRTEYYSNGTFGFYSPVTEVTMTFSSGNIVEGVTATGVKQYSVKSSLNNTTIPLYKKSWLPHTQSGMPSTQLAGMQLRKRDGTYVLLSEDEFYSQIVERNGDYLYLKKDALVTYGFKGLSDLGSFYYTFDAVKNSDGTFNGKFLLYKDKDRSYNLQKSQQTGNLKIEYTDESGTESGTFTAE